MNQNRKESFSDFGHSSYPRRCIHCECEFPVRTFHAGFSDIWLMKCDNCPAILPLEKYGDEVLSFVYTYYCANYVDYLEIFRIPEDYHIIAGSILAKEHSAAWEEFIRTVEENLMNCDCGGRFRFNAQYRCPCCNKELPVDSLNLDVGRDIAITDIYDGYKMWKRTLAETKQLIKDAEPGWEKTFEEIRRKTDAEFQELLKKIEKEKNESQ